MVHMNEGKVLVDFQSKEKNLMARKGCHQRNTLLNRKIISKKGHMGSVLITLREEWGWLKMFSAQPLPQPKVVRTRILRKKWMLLLGNDTIS